MSDIMNADYVIIGAGSAGCALAYRLSEAGRSVIIIEYGGSDIGPFIQMPAALSYPMNMKRYDWGFSSEPEPHLNNRKMATPRGKVIGGSSSINGMVYVRGHAQDFDTWEAMGAKGWSYKDVLPYFKRMENWQGGDARRDENLSKWRGLNGPLYISRGACENPLHQAFINAGIEAGYPATNDYNGEQQEGFGVMEQTIYKGRRWSAANAYLRPALKRKNCTLISGFAQKIAIENNRAIGVEITHGNGTKTIKANREVIIAASSINTPKLLMLSGIGNGTDLQSHGIEVIADRPGVGQNLQDHLELYIQAAASKPVSLAKHWNLISKAMIGARWLFTKTGLGASNQFESSGFIRSHEGKDYPDLQFHFLPIAVRYDGKAAEEGHGFQAHVGPMRSKSRGNITLASSNPKDAPKIRFNYMSHEEDWIDFRKGIRLTREIFSQAAFKPYYQSEIQPGSQMQSDEQLDEVIKEHAESAYHPCGTARMGDKEDRMAVVDSETRVIGVEGLRVADSSIFPQITNGNLNGPSIMVGEKAADHILGRSLPSLDDIV
jgi:choline dehydrogenase